MKKIPKPNKSERIFAFVDREGLFDEVDKVTNHFFYVMKYTMDITNLNHLTFYIFRLTRHSKYDIDTEELEHQLYPLGGRLIKIDKRALTDIEFLFKESES